MKKYLLGIIALSIAFASVAFTSPKQVKTLNPQWYYKNATTEGEDLPANYELFTNQSSCGGASSVRCVIEAPDDGGVPDLSDMTVISHKL